MGYEIEDDKEDIEVVPSKQVNNLPEVDPLSMSTIIQRLQPEKLYTINLGLK